MLAQDYESGQVVASRTVYRVVESAAWFPTFGLVAAIPIHGPFVRTTPLVQSRCNLRRHLPRLSHHVIELGENRLEFVVSEGHDPILGGAPSTN